MKRYEKLAILAALILAGCGAGSSSNTEVVALTGNVAVPATDYNLLSAFTAALPCNGQALVWSIREQGIGWAAIDGAISQSGVWTSPACGSAWLGQTLHVDARCESSGQTATAAIATVPESVTGVQVAYAVVTNPGQAPCLAMGQGSVQAGGTVQFYARVVTSCGEVVTPTPPASWPAACP